MEGIYAEASLGGGSLGVDDGDVKLAVRSEDVKLAVRSEDGMVDSDTVIRMSIEAERF